MTAPADRTARLRTSDITWQVVEDQVVLLDLRASHYVEFNASAALLFQLLAEGAGDDDLVAGLIARYDLDADVARADVADFLDELRGHDLLVA